MDVSYLDWHCSTHIDGFGFSTHPIAQNIYPKDRELVHFSAVVVPHPLRLNAKKTATVSLVKDFLWFILLVKFNVVLSLS